MQKQSLAYLLASSAILAACGGGGGSPSVNLETGDAGTPVDEVVVDLCTGTAITPERLFLQQLGSDRVIIKWRGNKNGTDEATKVCFGLSQNALPAASETAATVTETGHSEALITGLKADTTYYYSVGGAGTTESQFHFRTAPQTGSLPVDGNVRIWIVGDSGSAGQGSADPARVRDGYEAWRTTTGGGEETDLFLMLGDNAYLEGTDEQFQLALFDIYDNVLFSAGMWSCIGNHEMGSSGLSISSSPATYVAPSGRSDPLPDSPMPYLNIYTFPTGGESGGVASGTEQYYSFDYGNVHVVSLDSQLTARDEASRAAMLQWLKDDLAANFGDWTVVIFHHPPYTKGSHDSDNALFGIDQPIFDMREEFTPVFEDYGVDVVYSGHSHSYERSFYLNGHTGLEASFDPATHAELNGAGQPANGQGAEKYGQVAKNGMDDKVVYTVAGSSGQATTSSDGYPHDAFAFSDLVLGSVVIDANADSLTARFLGVDGAQLDFFTITR